MVLADSYQVACLSASAAVDFRICIWHEEHKEWNSKSDMDRTQLLDIVVRNASPAHQLSENGGGYPKNDEYPVQFGDFRAVSVGSIILIPYLTTWLPKRLQHLLAACPSALTFGAGRPGCCSRDHLSLRSAGGSGGHRSPPS